MTPRKRARPYRSAGRPQGPVSHHRPGAATQTMTANETDADRAEEPTDHRDVFASILSSRTVAVADDLHSTALDVEASSDDLEQLAEALEEAREQIEALDELTRRAQQ